MFTAWSSVKGGTMPPPRHHEREEEGEVYDERQLSNGNCRQPSASRGKPPNQG